MSINISMISMILIWILKALGLVVSSCLIIICMALFVLLFVPIKYQIRASLEETLMGHEIKGRCSWLFRVVHIPFQVIQGEIDFKVKIFGISVYPPKEKTKPIKTKTNNRSENNHSDQDIIGEDIVDQDIPKDETLDDKNSNSGIKSHKHNLQQKAYTDKAKSLWEELIHKLGLPRTYYSKLRKTIKKLKWHFKQLYDMIKRAIKGKETIVDFFGKERHKVSLAHLKKELLFIWNHSRPKKLKLSAKIGFEDPALTGQTLALLGVAMPFIGAYDLDIEPYFDEEIMEVNGVIKGRVYLYHILLASLRVIKEKENRLTYKAICRLKF